MARTIDDAFGIFIEWLKPTGTETSLATSHRATIEDCLKSRFGMTHFFRSGSFGHHTSVSGYSDVDYFAVIPAANLNANSNTALQAIKTGIHERLPRTAVGVRSPAVLVPFGDSPSEAHEIVPAIHVSNYYSSRVFKIPDRAGAWMLSSPEAYNNWVNGHDDRLNYKLKPLIRIMKAWSYYNQTELRSFWIKMMVTEWSTTQTTIAYKFDALLTLAYMLDHFTAMPDPLAIGSPIQPCNPSDLQTARAKAWRDHQIAVSAREHEGAGRVNEAFAKWGSFFNGSFPVYG